MFCLNYFKEAKLLSEMEQWDFIRGREFYTFSSHLSWDLPDSQVCIETQVIFLLLGGSEFYMAKNYVCGGRKL